MHSTIPYHSRRSSLTKRMNDGSESRFLPNFLKTLKGFCDHGHPENNKTIYSPFRL